MRQLRCRKFLGATFVLASGTGLGQPGKTMARIAALDDGDRTERAAYWQVFRQRLRQLGYIEGQNVAIDTRWADGDVSRLLRMAVELVRLEPDV